MSDEIQVERFDAVGADLFDIDAENKAAICFRTADGRAMAFTLPISGLTQLVNMVDTFMVGKTADAVPREPGQEGIDAGAPLVVATAIDIVRWVETGAVVIGFLPVPPAQPFRVGLSPELSAQLKSALPAIEPGQTAH